MKVCLITLLAASAWVSAQEADLEPFFDRYQEIDASAVIDYLTELEQKPLDLNRVTERQLRTIPWLAATAGDIIAYRRRHQGFTDVEELKKIKSVLPHYETIKQFFTVGPPPIRIHAEGRHRLVRPHDVGKTAFFVDHKFYHRLKVDIRDRVACGIMVEKDAGERQLTDLVHGFAQADLKTPQTQIIVGNFLAEFGERLVFGGSYRFGKGGDPIAPVTGSRNSLHPYISVDENLPFRGVGISMHRQTFELTAFFSDKRRDARLEDGRVVSLPSSGLHRTEVEIAIKDRLGERSTGAAVIWRPAQRIHLGVCGISNDFDAEFAPMEGARRDNFIGSQNRTASAFAEISAGTTMLFGEYAGSSSNGRAAVVGISADMSPVEWALLWRRYDAHFHSFYAAAFGEHDDARNENGFYFGCRYRLAQRSTVSFYFDQFSYPQPTPTLPMPSSGHELLLLFQQGFSPQLTLTVRLKTSDRTAAEKQADALGNAVTRLVDAPQNACRLQLDYQPTRRIGLRTRLEWTQNRSLDRLCWHGAAGVLLSQQIVVTQKPLRLAARWTAFDAPVYPLRLYQIEQDVPGALRLTMLYGRGVRWYLLMSYSVHKLRFTIKFEQTVHDQRVTVGDPLEHALALQADWRL